MAKIDAFFNLMFEQKASDLHLSSGNPPMLRINGELQRVDYPPLENDELKTMLYEIAPEYKIKMFEETGDVDFGYEIPNISRFRANFFNQKNGIGAVFRQIPSRVLSFEDFEKFDAPAAGGAEKIRHAAPRPGRRDRPDRLRQIHDARRHGGLRNKNRRDHIITVEDPIEFVHESKNCLVNHREVGVHTKSFAAALARRVARRPGHHPGRRVARPGNHRTGHHRRQHRPPGFRHAAHARARPRRWTASLTFSRRSSRTKSAPTLSEALKGVVAQNLFKRIDKKGRVAALEILVFTTAIANLVREGKTHQIPGMIQVGKKTRQPAAGRRHHGASAHETHLARGSLRQGAGQERNSARFLPHPPDDDET